ncbi:MAG TPA: MGMT family protein [Anaerolineales bacterium]|nr:MGMT family protein [Anaerolineales bacterium]
MDYIPPPDPQAYYEQVWRFARQIPYGQVATYGQLAQMIEPPVGIDLETYRAFSPRWAGNAMAACPPDVPWQRVINSQGKISVRPGAEQQRKLLEGEGVIFVKDKVDLKKFGWKGLSEPDEPRQGTLF